MYSPIIRLTFLRNRRMKNFEAVLPDSLDLMARALRSGHAVSAAIEVVAEQGRAPVAEEFRSLFQQQSLGMQFRDALEAMMKRIPSEDLQFAGTAMLVQKESGGNLAEILGNLCSVIRSMQTLHLRVRALSAEGRMSAQILSALPIGLVCFLLLTSPSIYTTKFDDPLFWPVVMVVLCWYLLGQFIVNRMVNFKY